MRFDHGDQPSRRKPMALDSSQQRRGDRIGARFAGAFAGDHVAPPLQPNFSRQRLVRDLAHSRYFGVESIERVEPVALVGGGKQRGNEAVPVGLPYQLGAMGEFIHGAAELSISIRRDQTGANPPSLQQHHIVGAHRRAGGHHVE